ncbi:MAG TPA: Asp-tRNA(Asn)/Glu-tRNA(Gln) amidotransferase GatCAB subunit A, partial [Advenella sp.]|nr:Asp-tRNA(Asn)/Glu-tRNA(Gln) amidotransferase GatCAB subunit A [Advenella sp.]
MTDISSFSLSGLRQALDGKQVSAVELAEAALNRAGQHASLNAFLHIDPELTLAQARAADERI